ncbi:MAG: TspO/MBR family protein [Chloroflexota bacterium]
MRFGGWLMGFLALTTGAASVGGLSTGSSVGTWYQLLRKPTWKPPDWLFGPVWTFLYAAMAVSAWLVRREMESSESRRRQGRLALFAWGGQLLLNVAWSLVFFGRRSVAGGLAVIAPLWAAIAATALLAARVSGAAGALLLPYLGWTSFAAALNLRIWQLNRRA